MSSVKVLDPPNYILPPVAPPPLVTPSSPPMPKNLSKGSIYKKPYHKSKYTESSLVEKAKLYFDWCDLNKKLPNIAGLCVFLDLSRQAFYEIYKVKYSRGCNWILNNIQDIWVQRLGTPYATGAIFYLKNVFRDEFRESVIEELVGGKPTPILAGLMRTIGKNKKIERNPPEKKIK